MSILPVAVLMLAPAAARAGSYVLPTIDGEAGGYRVTADTAPAAALDGTPALPAGARLTVEAPGAAAFEVWLVGPKGVEKARARRRWSTRIDRPGGYTVQFGRLDEPAMPLIDFVVWPTKSD